MLVPHSVCPGLQFPPHCPALQTSAQAVPFSHWPPPHDCGMLPPAPPSAPAQRTWLGAQTPWQAAPPVPASPLAPDATQVWPVHAMAVPQVPADVQVWIPVKSAVHCVCSGAQLPPHWPFMQVWFMQPTAIPQIPEVVQVSTALPEHRVSPGAQAPLASPPASDDPESPLDPESKPLDPESLPLLDPESLALPAPESALLPEGEPSPAVESCVPPSSGEGRSCPPRRALHATREASSGAITTAIGHVARVIVRTPLSRVSRRHRRPRSAP